MSIYFYFYTLTLCCVALKRDSGVDVCSHIFVFLSAYSMITLIILFSTIIILVLSLTFSSKSWGSVLNLVVISDASVRPEGMHGCV